MGPHTREKLNLTLSPEASFALVGLMEKVPGKKGDEAALAVFNRALNTREWLGRIQDRMICWLSPEGEGGKLTPYEAKGILEDTCLPPQAKQFRSREFILDLTPELRDFLEEVSKLCGIGDESELVCDALIREYDMSERISKGYELQVQSEEILETRPIGGLRN